jgi:hypothetical protein
LKVKAAKMKFLILMLPTSAKEYAHMNIWDNFPQKDHQLNPNTVFSHTPKTKYLPLNSLTKVPTKMVIIGPFLADWSALAPSKAVARSHIKPTLL